MAHKPSILRLTIRRPRAWKCRKYHRPLPAGKVQVVCKPFQCRHLAVR